MAEHTQPAAARAGAADAAAAHADAGPVDDDRAAEIFQRATDVRADAVRHLTALAGDASMCAIGRSGRSFPAAKYHEGRQSAASQVRRDVRQGRVSGLTAVVHEWQRTLAHAEAKGPDWIAYASGGKDALAEIGVLPGG